MSVSPGTVLLCRGKDCRKQKKATRLLLESIDGAYPIREVRCQDICSPVVVGFVHADTLVWAKKIKSTKDANAIFIFTLLGSGRPVAFQFLKKIN